MFIELFQNIKDSVIVEDSGKKSQLYSVVLSDEEREMGIITLVIASSPKEAIKKVKNDKEYIDKYTHYSVLYEEPVAQGSVENWGELTPEEYDNLVKGGVYYDEEDLGDLAQ